jgi:hypothetical protein
MIRRDYIIQMIEECIQVLMQIRLLRQGGRLAEARLAVDAECEKLAAAGAQKLAQLSEEELLARLGQDQPAHTLRARLFLLIALLQEAGAIATSEDRLADAQETFLKALDLLLEVSGQDDPAGHPAIVPQVDALVIALADAALPVRTQALLMRHYESTGQWAKAEDTLFSILDETTDHPAGFKLGGAFYQRILGHSDAVLLAGNLPRAEAEEGWRELQARRGTAVSG